MKNTHLLHDMVLASVYETERGIGSKDETPYNAPYNTL